LQITATKRNPNPIPNLIPIENSSPYSSLYPNTRNPNPTYYTPYSIQ